MQKLPLNKIKTNEANPRIISEDKFAKLVNSVLSFPKMMTLRPIVLASEQDTTILGGNMRFKALLFLEGITFQDLEERLKKVADFKEKTQAEQKELIAFWKKWKDSPFAEVEYATDLTDAEKRRFIIEDNASMGEWDYDMLANAWDNTKLCDWGVDVWKAEEFGSAAEVKEDDFNEDGEITVRCKKGDVWELGDHRLMCGDSIDLEQVRTLMGGVLADMVFTDPPYGVSYSGKNEMLNRLDKGNRIQKDIENDSRTPEEMYQLWRAAFDCIRECTKEKMAYYVTMALNGDLLMLKILQAIRDSGFALKYELIWNKNNHILGRCDYNFKHETIMYGWKIKGTHTFYGAGEFKTSVWDIPKPQSNDLHPTMKPVALVSNCILDTTKEGDIVLDVFGGSGTTMIAAEQLGRKCYTMEIDSHYCDVIIERWEQFTGGKAKKIN